jgi:hypothetical protein
LCSPEPLISTIHFQKTHLYYLPLLTMQTFCSLWTSFPTVLLELFFHVNSNLVLVARESTPHHLPYLRWSPWHGSIFFTCSLFDYSASVCFSACLVNFPLSQCGRMMKNWEPHMCA